MKQLIALIVTALAVTACSDQDHYPDIRLITFGTVVETETKAVVSGQGIPVGDRVGIYALEAYTAPVWQASGNLLDNAGAVSNEQGGLDYSPLKAYSDQMLYNFYAYYPYTAAATAVGNDGIIAPTDETAPKLRVTLEKTSDSQTDYLYAIPTLGYRWTADQPGITQVLKFKHALTQVRFRFSNKAAEATPEAKAVAGEAGSDTDNTVTIVSIEVKDREKGTMDITNGRWKVDDKASAETFTFFRSSEESNTAATEVKPIVVKAGESHEFTEQLMLFPKTGEEMTGNETLQFRLTLRDDEGKEEQITVTPQVPDTGLEAGNSYLYTLFYGSTSYEISLSAVIANWQEVDGGNLPLTPKSN